MPKGGHAHSGPAPDPKSRTSERKGYTLTALPAEGYRGDAPDLMEFLPAASDREQSIWLDLWTTPQACAWVLQPWRWPVVADLAMYRARADASDAPVALATAVRQLRDDVGLSEAGLRLNGWAIAKDEVAAKAAEKPASPKRDRRLRSVGAQ